MELFSLGIGNYTEKDIREAARAFTGWEIRNGQFFDNKAEFDAGEKTVLGKTGSWSGEDIVRICLEQKAPPGSSSASCTGSSSASRTPRRPS